MRLGRLRLQTNIVLLHIHVHIPLKGENLSFSCTLLERRPRTSPAARQPGAFRDPSISSLFCTVRHHALIATRRMTRQGSQAVEGLGRAYQQSDWLARIIHDCSWRNRQAAS
jgi:hypothetical protein